MILGRVRGGGWFFSSAGAQAMAALIGFFTNVVYARTLSLSEVGEIALVTAAALFSAVFADRGFGTWVTRNVASAVVSPRTASVFLLRASFPAWIAGGVVVSMLLFSYGAVNSVPSLFRYAPQWWVLLITFTLFQGVISLSQGTGQTSLRSTVIVVNSVATLGGVLVAAFFAPSASLYLWAGALGYLIAAAVGLGGLLRQLGPGADPLTAPGYGTARKESLPLLATNAITYAMGAGDVLVLGLFVGPSQVGLYQTAKKLAQAVSLPWSTVVPVLIGRMARSEDPRRLVRKFAAAASAYFVLAALTALLLGSWILSTLFGSPFAAAEPELVALMIAFGLQLARDLTGAVLIVRGRYFIAVLGQIVSLLVLGSVLPFVAASGSSVVFALGLATAFAAGAFTNFLASRRAGSL